MTKRSLLVILTIGLIVSLSGVAASSVLAANDNYNNPIIQRLAETFGVEEDEVEAVFDAVREEHQEEMQRLHQFKLQKAVEDGVISQEQLNALEEKYREMWEHRQEHHEEMESWFEQEGIDHEALMDYMGGHRHGSEFGMRGHRTGFIE